MAMHKIRLLGLVLPQVCTTEPATQVVELHKQPLDLPRTTHSVRTGLVEPVLTGPVKPVLTELVEPEVPPSRQAQMDDEQQHL